MDPAAVVGLDDEDAVDVERAVDLGRQQVVVDRARRRRVGKARDDERVIALDRDRAFGEDALVVRDGAGRDRVRVSGIRGGPRTPFLKVSIAYFYGYKAVGTLVYSWPDAYDKARAADRILRERLKDLGLEFEQILTEYVGVSATHGRLSGPPDPEAPTEPRRLGWRR
jgi:hypothetical protein